MTRERRETPILAAILLATLGIRLIDSGQPIVENYVGRQVPTAMVARNLGRGSGFLRPQLDTAPFPNLFRIEPPTFALGASWLSRSTGRDLEESGRLLAALATTLGAWGLFGLMRAREGPSLALVGTLAFALFPITIRYGRAFQGDLLAIGLALAGLRLLDLPSGPRRRAAFGLTLLAGGLATKVLYASVLTPLLTDDRRPVVKRLTLALLATAPAVAWYGYVLIIDAGARPFGSAGAANFEIWRGVLANPSGLVSPATWEHVGRFLVVRGFTPIGFALAAIGLANRGASGRIWRDWGVVAAISLAAVSAKLHHEYYFLALAPVAAAGLARGLRALRGSGDSRSRRIATAAAALAFASLAAVQAAPTWRVPEEWAGLDRAALAVRSLVPPDALLVAPEALLWRADYRGCRLEHGGPAARRAAAEWPVQDEGLAAIGLEDGAALVEFYQGRGATFLAEVGAPGDPRHLAFREAIRRRHRILDESPTHLVARLIPPPVAVPEDPRELPREARAPRDRPRLPALEGRRAQDRRAHRL